MNDLITLDDYTKGRDKQYPDEWTEDVKNNAIKLLKIVNSFLNELGIKEAKVSSGFRPAAINGKITNAAKKSYHMTGLAIDILDDKNQDLAKLIASKPDLLRKYNLWLESPASTKGQNSNWAHLDLGKRTDRSSRIFLP